MPVLQPAELWEESGRLNDYGPELMRLTDRHDREMCLGPTHEEIIVALVRNELRSYKELPQNLYQIQTKYRDEIRPRFGLLRSREFVMKDAYSFNATQESLQETYDEMGTCLRCHLRAAAVLDYREVEADGGQIGGKVTTEFMALAESGEADLVYCSCGYAADAEAGACLARPTLYEVDAMEKIATPWRAHHRRAGGVPEHPRVVHGEGAVGQGRRGQPRVPVHSRRPRAERAEDRGSRARLHAVDRRGDARLRPVQGLHGPGGAARGRSRHRRYQLAGHPAVGRGRQRGRLPLRGRTSGRGFPGGRVGRSGHGEARRLLPRRADFRWKALAASRWPRSSSSATSTLVPWAPPSWTRTARRSPSSWAATAWASRARWPPSSSSINDEHGIMWPLVRGAGPYLRGAAHGGRRRGAAHGRENREGLWPSSASRWSSTTATSAPA